jgi:hypothetical protein
MTKGLSRVLGGGLEQVLRISFGRNLRILTNFQQKYILS